MTESACGSLATQGLRERVAADGALWSSLTVVPETGSTNEDLVAAARAGAPEGIVLAAERQTRGRGRLGRQWLSEPGAALTFSVLLRPRAVPQAARGWLPLLTGVAVVAGIRAETGLDVGLKWPNDVLAGSAKIAGILAEQSGDAVVVGTGLNVAGGPPAGAGRGAPPPPTSLTDLGLASVNRTALLAAILRELEHWYLRWAMARPAGDAVSSGLRAEYLRHCRTIGLDVRVELPGGAILSGRACDVDSAGRLLVAAGDRIQPVSSGDVVHVR
jgi:BirA family transcriptional regulator, biotin operon repressor / biotin---[acetyl-CoA-carboxylase] ligase